MSHSIATTLSSRNSKMGYLNMSNGFLLCVTMVVIVLFGVTKADINEDKKLCSDKLVALSTCLPYVSGETKAPTLDCCKGLKQILIKSSVCLCILIKDRNDPSLGLKFNETLALGLPESCHTSANISNCVGLLHLQPGSPDAKVFEDYAKGIKEKNTTTVPPGDAIISNSTSSEGGRRKTYPGLKIAGVLFVVVMLTRSYDTRSLIVT